ncbi:MAG: hypothetical protein E6R13_07330 [Spirochaetes bacterium]|nr:MAG: hypothetical protein E6R13_07330 [Spirochaetota bacterium]
MNKFNLTKENFAKQYDNAIDEHLDICDWVTYIDGKTVCGFVYGILTKNDIDKPMSIEDFHELYLVKYNKKLAQKEGESSLNTQEVIDVAYDLLVELFTT